jgi:hypothetical protein
MTVRNLNFKLCLLQEGRMVRGAGFEPATLSMSTRYSNRAELTAQQSQFYHEENQGRMLREGVTLSNTV